MSVKIAFKRGFCTKLAELGIAPSHLDIMLKSSGVLRDVVHGVTEAAMPALGATLVAAPALAGWTLAGSKRINQADLDYITNLALLEDYKRSVGLMKRDKLHDEGVANKKEAAVVGAVPGTAVNMVSPAPTVPGGIATRRAQVQSAPVAAKIQHAKAVVGENPLAKPASLRDALLRR